MNGLKHLHIALLCGAASVCAIAQTDPPLPQEQVKGHLHAAFMSANRPPAPYTSTSILPSRLPDPTSTIYAIGDEEHAPIPVIHPAAPQISSGPRCSSPPAQSQLRTFAAYERLSLAQAKAFGLDLSMMHLQVDTSALLVWRVGAAAECTADDQRTTVLYGAEFDLAVALRANRRNDSASFSSMMQRPDVQNRIEGMTYRIAGFANPAPLLQALAELQSTVNNNPAIPGRAEELRNRLYTIDTISRSQTTFDPPSLLGHRP